MSMLKKLAGQTALYGLSSMLGRALNFLLVPFYTKVLHPSEFGVMTEFYSYVAFFNVLYLMGMETAYFRFSNKQDQIEEDVFNSAQSFLILFSISISLLLIIFSPIIVGMLDYPGKEKYIIWLSLILATDAVVAIPFARLRFQKKAGAFAATKVANIIINICLNLFFLVYCKEIYEGKYLESIRPFISTFYFPEMDVGYIFLSNLIANAMFLPMLWKSLSTFRFRLNGPLLKPMFNYAYPILIMGLAGMVNEMLSRIILRKVLPDNFYPNRTNMEALGIFGAAYRLSMFMSLAIQSFRYAAEPFFFSQAKEKNSPEVFSKVMHWFVITCLFLFLVVSLNLDIFSLILRNPVYREGILVVPFLLMGQLFLGVYYNLSVWYKLTDQTYFGTIISIGGALVTVLANLILIPMFGYMGSAFSTFLCYFLMSVASYMLGQKYFPVPYTINKIIFYVAFCSALVFISVTVKFPDRLTSFAVNLMLLLSFLLLILISEKKQLNFNRFKVFK